ncbi:RING-HC finger protein [archaeon]|nr:MAG: RING-HC finger protein [archaeon]
MLIDYGGVFRSPHRKTPPKPLESFCVVCLTNPVSSVAFVPCGHQVMCLPCLQDSTKRKDLLCPLCRQVIKQRITIYKP